MTSVRGCVELEIKVVQYDSGSICCYFDGFRTNILNTISSTDSFRDNSHNSQNADMSFFV